MLINPGKAKVKDGRDVAVGWSPMGKAHLRRVGGLTVKTNEVLCVKHGNRFHSRCAVV